MFIFIAWHKIVKNYAQVFVLVVSASPESTSNIIEVVEKTWE